MPTFRVNIKEDDDMIDYEDEPVREQKKARKAKQLKRPNQKDIESLIRHSNQNQD